MYFSFEDEAEEKCKGNIEKAIAIDHTNPDAFQLMSSFLLSKDQTQVTISIFVYTAI